ncbi:MAG: hypothetical protein L0241_13525, partial [Planctomycetia bacterium]|nr:hypothetical protein [Planctomycetia bacterium]
WLPDPDHLTDTHDATSRHHNVAPPKKRKAGHALVQYGSGIPSRLTPAVRQCPVEPPALAGWVAFTARIDYRTLPHARLLFNRE